MGDQVRTDCIERGSLRMRCDAIHHNREACSAGRKSRVGQMLVVQGLVFDATICSLSLRGVAWVMIWQCCSSLPYPPRGGMSV